MQLIISSCFLSCSNRPNFINSCLFAPAWPLMRRSSHSSVYNLFIFSPVFMKDQPLYWWHTCIRCDWSDAASSAPFTWNPGLPQRQVRTDGDPGFAELLDCRALISWSGSCPTSKLVSSLSSHHFFFVCFGSDEALSHMNWYLHFNRLLLTVSGRHGNHLLTYNQLKWLLIHELQVITF